MSKVGDAAQRDSTDEDSEERLEQKEADPPPSRPPPYNVFDFYKKHGMAQRIAKTKTFDFLTLFVITLNALWIGYDTNSNNAESIGQAKIQFQLAETFFCVYFTAEVVIRFMAFEKKLNTMRDFWFRFDSALVGMMVFETWVMPLAMPGGGGVGGNLSILRLLRLLRLTRMARLMRALPELLTLIKGMAAATRSVSCTLVLMVIFLYIFGIVFTDAFKRAEDPALVFRYKHLGYSMFTLFMAGTLLDNLIDIMEELKLSEEAGWAWIMIFWFFILLSSFTVLNMLIGVLCEVVTETSNHEAENSMVELVREEITAVFEQIDTSGDGTVSKEEFNMMKDKEEVKLALEKVGVEPKHFFALSDVLFEPSELPPSQSSDDTGQRTKKVAEGEEESVELEFDDFLEMVISQRPEKTASVMDAALLRQMFRTIIIRLDRKMDGYLERLRSIQDSFMVSESNVGVEEESYDDTILVAERFLALMKKPT
jgi:voltage-gated sodium channel